MLPRNWRPLAGMDLDKMMADARSRDFHPVPLPVKLQAHMVSKVRPFESNNVIAMLPGSDPKLKTEAVMYTAHYDHLGIRPDMPGDNIYNGADDNATGCGILLELAHAFADGGAAAAAFHSVCFRDGGGAGTAGLRVSGQASSHTRRKNRARLELRRHSAARLSRRSGSIGHRSAQLSIPRCRRWRRNSGWRFAPIRIPKRDTITAPIISAWPAWAFPRFRSMKASSTRGTTRPGECRRPDEYTEKHYHQPSDEYHPEMDFTGDAVMARFGFALGWEAASMPKVVGWEKGDEFEAARLKSGAN